MWLKVNRKELGLASLNITPPASLRTAPRWWRQLWRRLWRRAQKMSGLPKKEECVRVVVRCRPMSSKEKDDGRQKVVEMDKKRGSVRARRP